jgi:hypothetical protein
MLWIGLIYCGPVDGLCDYSNTVVFKHLLYTGPYALSRETAGGGGGGGGGVGSLRKSSFSTTLAAEYCTYSIKYMRK